MSCVLVDDYNRGELWLRRLTIFSTGKLYVGSSASE